MLIYNARIITPAQVISNGFVRIDAGKITHIGTGAAPSEPGEVALDAHGQLLMPGLIDIHTDAMEGEISPRRRADFPIEVAFRELERRNSSCGITTVYHSLHLGYETAEKNSESKYTRREIFGRVHELAGQSTLITNKIHLRYELTGIYAYETVLEVIEAGMIDLLSVMDHTPGQGQTSVTNFLGYMKRNGLSETEAQQKLAQMQATPKLSDAQMAELIRLAQSRNIPVASHDDDTAEKVHQMYRLGIRICEFPVSMEAAETGKALGMSVIGGAANVLRGGSLSGNLGVEEGIRAGVIDSLCSDYYPPSMVHSVFRLAGAGMALPDAVNLVSLHPAQAAGIDDHTGSIETGKAADLLLVDASGTVPLVTHTFSNGHLSARAMLQPQLDAVPA